MDNAKFYETLQELIELGRESGSVSDEILIDWFEDATSAQQEEIYDYLEHENIQIYCGYKEYLNNLRSRQKKKLFCYYILTCDLLGMYPSPSNFVPEHIIYCKLIIDEYIKDKFSKADQDLLKDVYGLNDGHYCLCFEEFVNKFEIPSNKILDLKLLERYYLIETTIAKESNIKNSKYKDYLYNISSALLIENFTTEKISCQYDEYLMYTPNSSHGSDFGPFIEKKIDGSEQGIGWLLKEGEIAHELTVNENQEWILRLYNLEDKPNPILKYQNNKLIFSLSFGKYGYNGYQFVFEKNEEIIVRVIENNMLLKETKIPYKFVANTSNLFAFNEFNDSRGETKEFNKDIYVIQNDLNEENLFYEYLVEKDGDIELLEVKNNKFWGMKTFCSLSKDFYGYCHKDENEDSNYVQLCIDNYKDKPIIRLRLRSDGPYCYVLVYDPFDLASPMILNKINANEKLVDSVDVLKEYLEELNKEN